MEDLFDRTKDYLETRIRLSKLLLIDKTVSLFANMVSGVAVILLIAIALIFVSLGLGFYLSEVIGNTYAGFLIVAALYFLIALIIFLSKRKIERPLMDMMVKKIMKGEDE